MKKIHYSEMLLHEFRAAMAAMPVAWVPVGLLEWHSEHLPLGTDVLRAEWCCSAAARAIGGIVLPPLYVSCRGYGSFEGTLIFSHDTAVQVGVELAGQLAKAGFRAALFLSAHGGQWQVAFLDDVARRYSGPMALLTLQISQASGHGDHAGVWETSDMMAARPELVELSRFNFPVQPIKQYQVPPETLCPSETRPWTWKDDWRPRAGAAQGQAGLDRIVTYCRDWLAQNGIGAGKDDC